MNNVNTLIIGDLHAPFIRQGYLEFCKKVAKDYKCKNVICVGDVLDNAATTYHELEPDGLSAGDELKEAKKQLKAWYKAFPNMKICIGNHDARVMRKFKTGGISKEWFKPYAEVIGCPNWTFAEHLIENGIKFTHGEGQRAEKRMISDRISIVQGHRHSEAYVKWSVSDYDRLFAMQIGWGGNQSAYSMNYAKDFAKGVVSCGVIYNGLPIVIPMPLLPKIK